MQIRRSTAALAIAAILLLGAFNIYQARVIKQQRVLIVELYYAGVELGQYTMVLEDHLKQALKNLEACVAGK